MKTEVIKALVVAAFCGLLTFTTLQPLAHSSPESNSPAIPDSSLLTPTLPAVVSVIPTAPPPTPVVAPPQTAAGVGFEFTSHHGGKALKVATAPVRFAKQRFANRRERGFPVLSRLRPRNWGRR